ncbi:SCO7613 C-terminal domain-containing membrane protein [Glaciihabitans sp. dw_435]|uniref:SCO7613 C-terminal domain-containing membrane protein n=1 Tax=Glaciihabitans sp. dw_435 TaxID=2720081 RepID=UPI001BD22567|nr:hypothetical protein [Glaciihabitans sp. dw_435]
MDDSSKDFAQFAGHVVFPESIAALSDTTVCPACQNVLTDVVCSVCGLDLTNPAAKELALVSIGAARLLNRRVNLIGRIRHATTEQAESAARAESDAALRASIPVESVLPLQPQDESLAGFDDLLAASSVAPPIVPPAPATPKSTAPAAPRRSSVQVTILVVAAALLSLAAIYFLIYAFVTYGIGVRSAIIGAITVAAYVTASLVRRRGLAATAESIGAVAIVLTYLDVYAARANDLAGLADTRSSVYWGLALVISAIGLAAWSRFSAVRMPGITASIAFPSGIGLLVYALSTPLEWDLRVVASLIAVALAGLVHPLAPRLRPPSSPSRDAVAERVSILSVAGVSLAIAGLISILSGSLDNYHWAISLAAVAVTAAAHLVVALRTTDAPAGDTSSVLTITAGTAAVFTAGPLALLGVAVAVATDNTSVDMIVPVSVAVVVFVLADLFRRRMPAGPLRVPVTSSAVATAVVISIGTAVVPVGTAIYTTGRALYTALAFATDRSTGLALLPPSEGAASAVVALAIVLLLATAYLATTRTLAARAVWLAWATGFLVIVTVPLLTSVVGITSGWMAVAVAALVAVLYVRPGAPLALRLRWPLLTVAAVSMVAGYLESWASTGAWWWASVVTIALLLAARRVVSAGSVAVRASLLSLATIVALFGVSVLATPWAGIVSDAASTGATYQNSTRFIGILATVLFVLAGLPRLSDPTNPAALSFSTLDRRVIFWLTGITWAACLSAGTSGSVQAPGLVFAEPATSVVLSLVPLAALALWILPTTAERLRPERAAAAIAVAPLAAVAFDAVLWAANVRPDDWTSLTAVPTLVIAAVSLCLSIARPQSVPRWAMDAGVAAVALGLVVAVAVTAVLQDSPVWLTLLLIAATVLLLAIDRTGLFASKSNRRHLGWLALAIGTASLWSALGFAGDDDHPASVEAYVLPVSGALLIIAALMWRAARLQAGTSEPETQEARVTVLSRIGAAPLVLVIAIVVSLVPIAVAGQEGSPTRAITVGAVSAALLLIPLWWRVSAGARPYTLAVAVAGAIGAVVTVVARVVGTSHWSSGVEAPHLDLWVGVGTLVFIAAAFGWSRLSTERRMILPSRSVVIVTMVVAVLLEFQGLFSPELGLARALTIVIAGSAVYVLGYALNRLPIDVLVGKCAIVIATLVAVTGLVVDTVDPIEQVSVPLALGLLGAGGIRLARVPALRSWSTIGLGTVVLLVPSLISTWVDPTAWRLVGLAVVAVAALVVGIVLRLQAPFVLGTVVVLIHAIGSFADEIRAVYENVPFWWWLAIGGVLLLLLGARYERRVQNLKSVVLKVGSLR